MAFFAKRNLALSSGAPVKVILINLLVTCALGLISSVSRGLQATQVRIPSEFFFTNCRWMNSAHRNNTSDKLTMPAGRSNFLFGFWRNMMMDIGAVMHQRHQSHLQIIRKSKKYNYAKRLRSGVWVLCYKHGSFEPERLVLPLFRLSPSLLKNARPSSRNQNTFPSFAKHFTLKKV